MYDIRKKCLQELLIGIYKTDRISYDDSQIIIEGKSLIDRCVSNKLEKNSSYHNWFKKLFNLTFLKSDTFFVIDTEGGSCKPDNPKKGQIPFKTKDAIDNADKFLKGKGVDLSILSEDKSTNAEKCEEIIFEILCIYLKHIFEFTDNTVYDTAALFKEAFPEIQYKLLMKVPSTGKYVHTTEDNSVVETGMSKAECNRYIPVGIDDLGIPPIANINIVNANIRIIKTKQPQIMPEKDIGTFRYLLMRDLCKYDPSEDIVCDDFPIPLPFERDEYTIDSPKKVFNISKICPDYNEIANLKIFYLFKIDRDKIGAFYPDVKTSYDLREAIIAKANKDLRIPFIKKIKDYYIDVIDYIEDVLKRILSIDTEKMINGEVDDKIVSAFNIEYDYISDYLEKNCATYEKSLYLYIMIDRAINDFNNQITVCVERMAKQIVEYIDTDRIKEHIKWVENFISSDKIKKAIIFQENDENEHPEKYCLLTDDMTWNQKRLEIYKKKTKGLFKNLRCGIETYLYWLKNTLQEK